MRVLIIAALMAVSGCALLSEETLATCDLLQDQYKSYIDSGTPDLATIGDTLEACKAGAERDSKQWEFKWTELEQAIRDALDAFLPNLMAVGEGQKARSTRATELKVQLNGYRPR